MTFFSDPTFFWVALVFAGAYFYGEIKELKGRADMTHEALTRSIDASIAVKAIEKSSHTLIPVHSGPNGLDNKDLEAKLRNLAGVPQEDFQSDLDRAGFGGDLSIDNPEDQV